MSERMDEVEHTALSTVEMSMQWNRTCVEVPFRAPNFSVVQIPREPTPPSKEAVEDEHEKMGGCKDIQISISKLKEKLEKASKSEGQKISIRKVPRQLREVNHKAYEPQLISIGPYHRHMEHLEPMEERKKLYLISFLARNENVSLNEYFVAMRSKENVARQCYAKAFDDINPIEFTEMMLLDGCFIVELIRLNSDNVNQDKKDGQIIKLKMDLPEIAYDLLLLENQLPLFILKELFDMSKKPDEDESFVQKALSYFCSAPDHHQNVGNSEKHNQHLLGLVYRHCVSRLPKRDFERDGDSEKPCQHLLGLVNCQCVSKLPNREVKHNPLRSILNAKRLEEAGITFKKAEKIRSKDTTEVMSLFDIKFDKEFGIMKIPSLKVDDNTERIFRNLIAYEQAFKDDEYERERYVTDYAVMMDCLINYYKDVELLQQQEVIDNWLGDNVAVAKMFNDLCHHVKISKYFYYQRTHEDVREYCEQPWNEWKQTLRHDYFNSPWALISFLAALLLLLITVSQFILSFF